MLQCAPMAKRKHQEFCGNVIYKRLSPGSKSERMAVVLKTDSCELVLRKRGGNPFVDETLDKLVGKRILARGIVAGTTLIMDSWDEES